MSTNCHEDTLRAVVQNPSRPLSREERSMLLRGLCLYLHVRVEAVWYWRTRTGRVGYELHVRGGSLRERVTVRIPAGRWPPEQARVRRAVRRAGLIVPEKVTRARWEAEVRLVLDICAEPRDLDADALAILLRAYLDRYPPDTDEWKPAALDRRPFLRNGWLYIHRSHLADFILNERIVGLALKVAGLIQQLHAERFEHIPRTVRFGGGRYTRSFWRAPLSEVDARLGLER